MKLLLKAGADVNRNDAKGMTALMYVARNRPDSGGESVVPDPSTWIKLLLEAGAVVNTVNKEGRTALMEAVESSENTCVKLLLKAETDVNIIDRFGCTALMMSSNTDQVEMLLQYGAPANWANEVGMTVLLYVARDGRHNAHELVERLLEAGADVNATDVNNSSILAYAACATDRFLDPKAVKVAIKQGARVNVRNICGQNSLEYYLAMGWERDEKLALLLFAAGELLDVRNVRRIGYRLDDMGTKPLNRMDPNIHGSPVPVPDCLLDKNQTICLKSSCRKTIRKHLLKIDLHTNFFQRIPKLGLPSQLQKYLLYATTLDLTEDRGDLYKEEMYLLGPKLKGCRICYKLHNMSIQ